MSTLQIKNMPDSLHRRLRRYTQKQRCTLSDFACEAIEKELARREFHERLARRPKTDLGISVASLLEEEKLASIIGCIQTSGGRARNTGKALQLLLTKRRRHEYPN